MILNEACLTTNKKYGMLDNISILIVEDDVDSRDLLERSLSEIYPISTADSLQAAIEKIAATNPAIVLTDIRLEGVDDGIELIKYAKSINSDAIVIFISGYANKHIAIEAMRMGAFDFIEKPIGIEDVKITVERAAKFKILLLEKQKFIETIKLKEMRNRAMIEAVPDMIYRIDGEGKILDQKQNGFADLSESTNLGKQPQETINDILPGIAPITLTSINRAVKTGQIQYFEFQLGSNEDECFFEARIAKSGENEAILICRDITENKRKEKLIANQQADLILAAKMSELGEMSIEIAHEIYNPLSAISNTAELVTRELGTGAPLEKSIQRLEKIMSGTERIFKIVKGLRALGRQSENDPFRSEHLKTIVENALSLCEARIRNEGIRVTFPTSNELDFKVYCREAQVTQVLINLLNNAYDAVSTLSEKWIRIEIESSTNEIGISVTDSGNGIPKHLKQKILEPFYTTKPTGRGTGLGLSISKRILSDHGGNLQIDDNSPNTRFKMTLPRNF